MENWEEHKKVAIDGEERWLGSEEEGQLVVGERRVM